MTRFIAHRGFSKEEKQNTVNAFRCASTSDAYGIETDVRITKDGVFVAFHDKSTARLSGKYKIIEETYFEDVQKLKVYDGQRRHKIPTFIEFLQNCKSGNKKAIVEIKSDLTKEQTENLIRIIESEDYLSNTVFISFNAQVLKFIREKVPSQPIQMLAMRFCKVDLEFLKEYRFGLDISHWQLTKDRVVKCHEHGIDVNCWTVNSCRRAGSLQQWGVDYITTDKRNLSRNLMSFSPLKQPEIPLLNYS